MLTPLGKFVGKYTRREGRGRGSGWVSHIVIGSAFIFFIKAMCRAGGGGRTMGYCHCRREDCYCRR